MADNDTSTSSLTITTTTEIARLRCLQWRYLDFLVSKLENSKRYTVNSLIMEKLDTVAALENEVKELRVRLAKDTLQKNLAALKESGNTADRVRYVTRKLRLYKNRIRFRNGTKAFTFSSPVVQLKKEFSGESTLFSAESKKLFESIARLLRARRDKTRLEKESLTKANKKLARLKQKYKFYQLYRTML